MKAMIALNCAEMDRLFIRKNITAKNFDEALKRYGAEKLTSSIQKNNKKGNKIFSVWVYLENGKQVDSKKYSVAKATKTALGKHA